MTGEEIKKLMRRLVKETPFTPTATGLDLHVSFDLLREMQDAVRGMGDLEPPEFPKNV